MDDFSKATDGIPPMIVIFPSKMSLTCLIFSFVIGGWADRVCYINFRIQIGFQKTTVLTIGMSKQILSFRVEILGVFFQRWLDILFKKWWIRRL